VFEDVNPIQKSHFLKAAEIEEQVEHAHPKGV
jgi:hypothetical protein